MRVMGKDRATGLLVGLVVFSLILVPWHDAGAQSAEIGVKRIELGNTVIIEFENISGYGISEIRLWLLHDGELKSFKGENGWTGSKNPDGVLIFTTSTALNPGEVAKFGIKAGVSNPEVSWEAFDASGVQIGSGTSQSKVEPPTPVTPPPVDPTPVEPPVDPTPVEPPVRRTTIFEGISTLAIIPEKPKVASNIRVIGMGYATSEILSLYVDGEKMREFETDSSGNFVITSRIPHDTQPGRIDFTVRDAYENEKKISLRVSEREDRMVTPQEIPLTIHGLPEVIHRGETIRITGTAAATSTITAQIKGPEDNTVTTEPRPVDAEGNWAFETTIAQDTLFGRYEAIVTDGISTINVSWMVESSKIIEIVPTTLKFEPGELMVFNGTAIPNESIEFILENPQGIEIFSDIVQVDNTGAVRFTYQTEQSTQEGTYVLLAKQRDSTEIIVTGLGELPKEQIVATLDKLNYQKSDVVKINIDGPASSTLTLLIVDPSDREKFSDNIVLQPNGKLQYELDLDDYSSGVYTMVLSRANSKTTEIFSVGLQTGSGSIEISTTKQTYKTNDPILILGKTNANILIIMQLINPQGDVIKSKETFTSKDGRISESAFRIPSNAQAGVWQIKAISGSNFAVVDLDVVATVQEGMIITVEGIEELQTIGSSVKFHIIGAKNTVKIIISDDKGTEIQQLTSIATKDGVVKHSWPIPKDLPPGTYTITATDAFDSASATFTIDEV